MVKDFKGPKPVIGLVGGIGSGKSEVAALLARYGGRVVSGDEAGHAALRQQMVKDALMERWGKEILNSEGEINRSWLASRVFNDAKQREALEAIVFPKIRQSLEDQIAQAQSDMTVPFIVLDAAIMLEAGWHKVCNRLVYIDAPRSVRVARILEKRGWSEAQMDAREQAQWPLERKRVKADAILTNDGTLEYLESQVKNLLDRWGIVLCKPGLGT